MANTISVKLLSVLITVVILSGCTMPVKIIQVDIREKVECKSKHPIVRAFVHNDFNEVDISAQLIKYGKHDIDGFCEFLKKGIFNPISGGNFLDIILDKVKCFIADWKTFNCL